MAIPTVDQVWADFSPDGSVKEPNKQDIRRLLRYIQGLALTSGMKAYPNKTVMDADTTQENGTPALLWADPVDANNYPTVWVWNDGPNQWIEGVDRIEPLRDNIDLHGQQIKGVAGSTDGLYAATGAPRPVVFTDTSSYEQIWKVPLSNPQTRFTIQPTDAGLELVGLPGLSAPWPVGIKTSWDLVPGDSYYFEGVYTAGSSFAQLGFWFGTDPARTGYLTDQARMTVYRDRALIPCLANGISGDPGRSIEPNWIATGPVATGVVFGFAIDVLGDRSLRYRVYRDGLQQLVDVVVTPGPVGALVVGLNIINGATGRITKLLRKTNPGKTIWIDNTATDSGDGSRGNPLKTVLDVPAYLAKIGYQDEITINWLSDDDYGYLQCKDSLAGKWNLNGRPGGKTRLNGYLEETIVWSPVTGTGGKVFSTDYKWGNEVRSQVNQPFLMGVSENPRPWYTFPNLILEFVLTANGGVDMAGLIGGAYAATNGKVYIRLPDGLGPDPATVNLRLSRTHTIVEVVGGSEVNITNMCLRYSSVHVFVGGSGRGVIRNCEAEWSGWNANGFECHNGSYRFENPQVRYVGNDGIARSTRTDIPFQDGAAQVIEIINPVISHTKAGDAISQHFNENNHNACITKVINPWIHDCWKCGIVSSDDLLMVEGGVIERCGTAQLSLFGIPTVSSVGRTQRAFVNGTVIDPQGVGTIGVQNLCTDGMALLRCDLSGVWIGTPVAGSGSAELVVSAIALAGQTRDPTKNILAYRDCSTERTGGSVVKIGSGTAGTFLPIAANALT